MAWPRADERVAQRSSCRARPHSKALPTTIQPCAPGLDPLFDDQVHELRQPGPKQMRRAIRHIAVWCIAGAMAWVGLLSSIWVAIDIFLR